MHEEITGRSEDVTIYLPFYISRRFIQSHKEWTFLYGNDYYRKGCLGQAWEFAQEENTIAIPTCNKLCPSSSTKYWQDGMYDTVIPYFEFAFADAVKRGKPIIPCRKIGEGCSRLKEMSPNLFRYMHKQLDEIKYSSIQYTQDITKL